MLKLVFQEGKWLKKLLWFTAAGAGISVFVIAALQFFTEWKWGLADIWPIFILITGSAVAFWAFCVGAVWAVTGTSAGKMKTWPMYKILSSMVPSSPEDTLLAPWVGSSP